MSRTYVDSSVLIEAYRGAGPLAASANAILFDPSRTFVTSEFVRLEVLPKATYYQRATEVAFYARFLQAATRSVALTRSLMGLAQQRAETFGLSAVNALHVAAAETAHADELVTAERRASPLLRVTTIRVVSLHP
jgi:predicted nucleic acid-binding protein